MRIARSFSTIICRSRQALYEPYVSPLNEEQKKALRKIIAKEMPRYNGRLNKDIHGLLQAFQPPELTTLRRKQTIEHVEQIIKAAYGPDYSVIDRSLHTYARDISCAPLELAVRDGSRPNGFPPGTEDQPFPDPYSHEALAKLFQGHGYTGSFIVGDTTRTLASEAQQPRRHYPIGDKDDHPVNPPWTSFTQRPIPHLTYPPVLYAEHVSEATMPFFLSPPMPTHLPLVRLLDAYFSLNRSYSDLISLVFIWIRSIDLPQLTPTCIALMVIGFLQVQRSIPSLQNPSNLKDVEELAERDEGVWVRAEWRPRYPPKAFWIETGFTSKPFSETSLTSKNSINTERPPTKKYLSTQPKNLAPLLYNFFQFWSQEHTSRVFICSENALSVHQGTIIPRVPLPRDSRVPLRRDQLNRDKINDGQVPWTPTDEPIMWQSHPIAIPDPFISSYNHAQSLSKPAGNYFHYFSSLSHRTIFHGHPLGTIMGPHLPIPDFRRHRMPPYRREYHVNSLGNQAKEFYESMLPSPDVLASRAQTISRVQKVIKDKYGDQYFVKCFGSTQYGVSSSTSDLDLVIMDPQFATGCSPTVRISKLPAVYNVNHVGRVLLTKGFSQVVTIPRATVPIVKFRDPATGLECDLNTNDRLGSWNTKLIGTYCDISSDIVRPMIMIIKQWAKSHGLNDPSGRVGPTTFSSYALVLMVIGFLQVKGVLPNLQAGLKELPKVTNRGIFWVRRKKHDPVRCDIRFSDGKDWRPTTHMDVAEALKGWFMFWADEFNYSNDLLSIRVGELVERATKPAKDKKKKKKKVGKTEAVSLIKLQESVMELEEENAIAAWRSQNNAKEDVELERAVEVEEIFEEAAESQNTSGDENGGPSGASDEEAVDVGTASGNQSTTSALQDQRRGEYIYDKFTEPHDHSDRECGVEFECLSLEGSQTAPQETSTRPDPSQPNKWLRHSLIVVDPFVLDKNVCGTIKEGIIERFKGECHKSVVTLTSGGDLMDLMGDGEPLPGPVKQRGKRRQNILS